MTNKFLYTCAFFPVLCGPALCPEKIFPAMFVLPQLPLVPLTGMVALTGMVPLLQPHVSVFLLCLLLGSQNSILTENDQHMSVLRLAAAVLLVSIKNRAPVHFYSHKK